MKFIEGQLYVDYQELKELGVSSGTMDAAKLRGSTDWKFKNDPDDKRKVLIHYETLKDKYKELITAKYGNPYLVQRAEILNQYMTGRPEDIDFLCNYRLQDGRYLPKETLDKYISGVKVLHFLSHWADRKRIGFIGMKDMKSFWELISGYIAKIGAALPKNVKRLQAVLEEYRETGPQCIISKHFLNSRALKMEDDICTAYLLELLGHYNHLQNPFVCQKYNDWAKLTGYQPISLTTVYNWRQKNRISITLSRDGNKAWQDKFGTTIHRERPSMPLALINSDDNVVDLFFINDKNHFWRPTVIVVLDVYNNYPLGWAIGEGNTIALVREAYLNAIHHIKELTGDYYVWNQIQADKWAKSQLEPWYKKQAQYIPGRTGNSRARRIEAFWNHDWHTVLKQYSNYSGHNITAKEKTNPDAMKAVRKNHPLKSEAHAQLQGIMEQLRDRTGKTGQSVRVEWLSAWSTMLGEYKRQLTDASRLHLYGKVREHKNTITKDGLILTIDRERIIYDIPAEEYAKHVGKQLNVIVDPYDASKVLAISDDESVKILCPLFEKFRDAIIDMKPGDMSRLNNRMLQKDLFFGTTTEKLARQKEILHQNGINAESFLIAGYSNKEIAHSNEQRYLEAQYAEDISNSEPSSSIQENTSEDFFTSVADLNDNDE